MRILFFGDVVGKPGRAVIETHLRALRRELKADFVIVNGENAAGGLGITPQIADEFLGLGADVITLGNHWGDKRQITAYIDEEPRLLRPLNYPPGTPGLGSYIYTSRRGPKVAVVNLHGRALFPFQLDDPFRLIEEEVRRLRVQTPIIFVDFHGEATSEKVAMGWFLAGKVSAVVGTHTHVQTADETILPGGTAYLTDVGMNGPWHSVIGVKRDLAIERFMTAMPVRFEVENEGPLQLAAVLVELDEATGQATAIQRILNRDA